MTLESHRELLWRPSSQRRTASGMWQYASWVSARAGLMRDTSGSAGTIDYDTLWAWSTAPASGFWASLAEFSSVIADGSWVPERADAESEFSGAGWFPGVRLNYAEQALRGHDGSGPAIVEMSEARPAAEVTWPELREQVGAFAARLREWGIRPGDRVAGFMPSRIETVVALLGSAAVGAVWTCCAPDYGVDAVLERLEQVRPRVLVAVDGYRFAERDVDCTPTLRELSERLSALERVVLVSKTRGAVDLDLSPAAVSWDDVVAARVEPQFERVPFDHPLWILYSSGTTGLPKGIVHSQGGIVLEHLKWLRLHADVQPGDRFFWYSSTAWVVWNAAVASLMVGATVVLYEGSPNRPRADRLWEIAAATAATQFGTGAAYLSLCQKAGLNPADGYDLGALKSIFSSGSVLPDDSWRWVYTGIKSDVWLDAPCGGTDIASSYVGGNPLVPVYVGEVQCRLLGAKVESWDEDGRHAADRVGELVVTAPMPSMPVRFWNDPDGSKFHESYFSVFPGVWRHGDWITINSHGGAKIHGRSDSTINRNGVRIGSADIYAAVERIPEIRDSLVIGAEFDGGRYWMPLFVTLIDGAELDDSLRTIIADEIRKAGSVRHVPDEILVAPAIPRTLTGKRLEVPVKRLVQGLAQKHAVNVGVVDQPDVLEWFVALGAEKRIELECNPNTSQEKAGR